MKEIIKKIKRGAELTKEEELKLLDSSKKVPRYYLYDEAEVKMLEIPERVKLLEMYLSEGSALCDEAEVKMLEMPERGKLLRMYLAEGWYLGQKAQLKLLEQFEAPELTELLKLYLKVDNSPCKELKEKAIALGLM
ncbi:MAG: hypothetical protein J6J35_04950 [Alphaproteobacteria bacterium]|nr:hypothetical protein [Alphaproteobacteria bacterium]